MTARPQGARRHPSEAPRSRPDWRLLGILLVALVLRGGLLLVAAGNDERLESTDVPEYLSLARDLRGGYVDEADPLFEIGLKRTPAYPAFLALVLAASGGSVEWATFVGILIAVGTVGLTFALARDLFGPPAGYGAALLIAIDPASVAWSNFLQPESLFTLLLTGAVVLWYRAQRHGLPWQAAVAGLLVGVAILTRPVALYLPLVLVAVGWLIARVGVRQRIAVGLTFLIVSALPVAAWVTRNVAVTGVAFVSTVESLNMLYYRAAGAVAEEQGISVRQARQRLFAEVDGRRGPGENAAELARRRTALGVQTLLDHPVG
ncbi:MAG: glycosyltransferase family 39 protein, partial [Actinomycetota bacterium]|nr:glycosyltransferase family 39 protein [Actinomycetota bacterium]